MGPLCYRYTDRPLSGGTTKIDLWRSISTAGSRSREKKGRRRGKEERRGEEECLMPSSPVHCRHLQAIFLSHGEKDRGDCRTDIDKMSVYRYRPVSKTLVKRTSLHFYMQCMFKSVCKSTYLLVFNCREFEYDQVMHLWEVLWTHYLSEHLHLYMCVAILKSHRKKIMGEQMDFDTLLKFINELSGNIDLDWTIREAEALCICAGENGAASIPPGTPPSLPIEPDMGLYPQEDEVL
ncbi:hypothetical protein BHM03_00056997 [Ensete ventricosum]|nr:hypothetical protein BHM03_00056997 [Ensete ventricosum]